MDFVSTLIRASPTFCLDLFALNVSACFAFGFTIFGKNTPHSAHRSLPQGARGFLYPPSSELRPPSPIKGEGNGVSLRTLLIGRSHQGRRFINTRPPAVLQEVVTYCAMLLSFFRVLCL